MLEDNGDLTFYTTDPEGLEQAGPDACALLIDESESLLFSTAVPQELFESLKPKDVKGTCISDVDMFFVPEECGSSNGYQIQGAGNIQFADDGSSFTAHVVVMKLEPTL